MFLHDLGKVAKDKITGFKGIIVGRCEHLYGCNTYGLTTQITDKGVRIETEWFDEARIIVSKKEKGITVEPVRRLSGGEYTEHP